MAFCSLVAVSVLATVLNQNAVSSFSISNHLNQHAPTSKPRQTSLSMAGGMGMGSKKKDKKKPKKIAYDVAKAMMKSERLYEKIMAESTKSIPYGADEDITREFIIAARCKPGAALPKTCLGASDWVPVAQLCVTRPVQSTEAADGEGRDAAVRAAVSHYCREANFAATLASPSTFKSLPRSSVEYSAEPTDEWFKFVYDDIIEGKRTESFVEGDSGSKVSMTKSKAREILGLESNCKDASLIKSAYKKQSMALHPDRFASMGVDRSQEEITESSNKFGQVKMAYDALQSGVRNVNGNGASRSWYESLGGKSRTEFVGPIDLMSAEKAGALCNKAFQSALCGLDHDLTMTFVARNQDAAREFLNDNADLKEEKALKKQEKVDKKAEKAERQLEATRVALEEKEKEEREVDALKQAAEKAADALKQAAEEAAVRAAADAQMAEQQLVDIATTNEQRNELEKRKSDKMSRMKELEGQLAEISRELESEKHALDVVLDQLKEMEDHDDVDTSSDEEDYAVVMARKLAVEAR